MVFMWCGSVCIHHWITPCIHPWMIVCLRVYIFVLFGCGPNIFVLPDPILGFDQGGFDPHFSYLYVLGPVGNQNFHFT